MSSYEIVERGQKHTLSYRCYLRDAQSKKIVSPFHDVPLVNERLTAGNNGATVYNMIVEVPRWTNAKMEINKKLPLNPITQDVKNGKPRFVHNISPYHGYLWNYGALPQTWEDPTHTDPSTSTCGDNDPLDVCEIGSELHSTGSVVPVKIIGVLGLIDEGETDWKLIAIDVRDKLAAQLNDIEDVEKLLPGLLEDTRRWFKYYKVPTGKPANKFAMDEKYGNQQFARNVIEETAKYWQKLAQGAAKIDPKSISLGNTSLNNGETVQGADAEKVVDSDEKHNEQAAPLESSVHQLVYVNDAEDRLQKRPNF